MLFKVFLAVLGLTIGTTLAYFVATKTEILNVKPQQASITNLFKIPKKEVIGFLPFWLIDKANQDYSPYITMLSYFNLTIASDGTIQKFTNPTETDPGWGALSSGKVDDYLANSKSKGIKLSLTVFNGDSDSIGSILEDPKTHAQNLVNEVAPIMNQYGFSDLNLDMEEVKEASPEARARFSQFVAEVKKNLSEKGSATLTIDVSPIAFVKNTNLVDPPATVQNVDRVLLMAYDFHNPGSFVTGPVSPETGAGTVSEFDTETAVKVATTIMPPYKLILGIPLYGYAWETINDAPRSAVIPATSLIISNRTVEDFLASCASCSAEFDKVDKETHVIYKDTETATFHQIFYPDKTATQSKVDYANSQNLGGIGLWALGYEGSTILQPLAGYRR